MKQKDLILQGKTALGIEFGSTRIKAVLVDLDGNVLAIGFHDWENSLVNGIWTYSLDEIREGLQDCYASLK
ncbi:MAG: ATPase, partial [Blautia sp.]|nr:ATPase [Blautia sp.]